MCTCSEYVDLEFSREEISKRIKKSRSLKKQLSLVTKNDDKEHALYKCNDCNQLWQGSRAWNWGNDEYLFKVPEIEKEKWLEEVYVQPDELLIFVAILDTFLSQTQFTKKDENCRIPECQNAAVSGSVNCLQHHVEALQRIGKIPSYPEGRWFNPYLRENIVPAL